MAQLLVRDIDEVVSRLLAERATREGKTAEELVREMISRHVDATREELSARLDEIRLSTIGKNVIDPVEIIRRDRDRNHAE